MSGITVTRIGTQVVVRVTAPSGCPAPEVLDGAFGEVTSLALAAVVVDLDDVAQVDDALLGFLVALDRRWRVRLLNAPPGVRERLRHRRSAVV